MSLNIIKDIESFFSSIESSIAGKLSGASADVVKKTVAIAHVAEHLAATFAADVDNTWEKLDGQTVADIIAGVTDNLQASNYEKAALGVVYLVYQGAVEATNKVDALPGVAMVEAKADTLIDKIEGEAETIWTGAKADVAAVVDKVESAFSPAPAPEVAAAVVPPPTQPAPVQAPAVMTPNLAS
ncbi:MAG: hypothetical protein JWP44_5082 [Mucilaginibacter sp.]|nr:hypothetical protein [Mucilaginibacter sp.]